MSNDVKPILDPSSNRTFIIIILSVVIIWLTFTVLNIYLFSLDREGAGMFGDTFGMLNSLFSALAFAGLFYTILIQRKELADTKEEMRKQNATLTQQSFEGTFFNVMNSHEVRRKSAYGLVKRMVTQDLPESFYKLADTNVDTGDTTDKLSKLQEHYETIYNLYLTDLQPYLRTIHAILSLIEDTPFTNTKKNFYLYLLYSTLSVDECTFLQYHSKLSLDREPGLHKRFKKITRFAGVTLLHKAHNWLFLDYQRPDAKKTK